MDGVRAAVRIGVVTVLGLMLGMSLLWAGQRGDSQGLPLLTKDGSPMPVPAGAGVLYASWDGQPVIVLVQSEDRLQAVEALRGPGAATPSVPLPADPTLRIFAFSAKSTFLGCTVRMHDGLGASNDIPDYDGDGIMDGRALDQCHYGQWDVYNRGAPVPGTQAPAPLPVLDVFVEDGFLAARAFDGRTQPQGSPS